MTSLEKKLVKRAMEEIFGGKKPTMDTNFDEFTTFLGDSIFNAVGIIELR